MAVAFLLNSNVNKAFMHRDIKPDNILFHNGNVKIADFGFAKTYNALEKNVRNGHTQFIGTPYYMSPQILEDEKYSGKTDIWSTGFTLYEAIFLEMPWDGESPKELAKNIKKIPLKFKSGLIQSDLEALLRKMLTISEEERYTWENVYNDPALKYIELEGEDLH